jgi:hypothetical protein
MSSHQHACNSQVEMSAFVVEFQQHWPNCRGEALVIGVRVRQGKYQGWRLKLRSVDSGLSVSSTLTRETFLA